METNSLKHAEGLISFRNKKVNIVTLIISIISDYGIWQSSDHQLTFPATQPTGLTRTENGIKQCQLKASNGFALLGYAGIGTVEGKEISDWMRRIFAGKQGTIEAYMGLLAEWSTIKLSPVCSELGTPHAFLAACYEDEIPTIYWVTNKSRKAMGIGSKFEIFKFRLIEGMSVLLVPAGSGEANLNANIFQKDLIKIIKKRRKKPQLAREICECLFRINKVASRNDPFVGDKCLVSYVSPGSECVQYRCYKWKDFDRNSVPFIANGFDFGSFLGDPLVRLSDEDPDAYRKIVRNFSPEEAVAFFNKGPLKLTLNKSIDEDGTPVS